MIYTIDRVCLTHATPLLCRFPAVLRPCRLESDFSGPRHSTVVALNCMC